MEFKGWLQGVPSNPCQAFCRLCNLTLKAHYGIISRHSKGPSHIERAKTEGLVIPLTNFVVKTNETKEQKTAELKLAVFIAEHSAIKSVDHLGELLSQISNQASIFKNIRIHRTKCSKLLLNVIAPSLHKELVEDIRQSGSFYSLILDESTDVSWQKCLCMMIRYYSCRHRTIVTPLYSLVNIERGDADTQVDTIVKQLKSDDLSLKKLIGIGVDGASVNVGSNHSISTLLREECPDLVTFKCVSHSLHLAASKAMDSFPRHLEFMVRETCSWFTCSTKRQGDYRALYAALCDGEVPNKIGKFSETRWLSRQEILKKILGQWDALTLHFQISRNTEKCYTAQQLFDMFSNPLNKVYLTFLSSELDAICKLNKMFQAENADVTRLFDDLCDYYVSLVQRIVYPSSVKSVAPANYIKVEISENLIPASALHLGYSAQILLDSISSSSPTIEKVKEICLSFLQELANQVRKRLPDSFEILKDLSLIAPKNATSQVKSSIAKLASRFPSVIADVDTLDRKWFLLHTKIWKETKNTQDFWDEVLQFENADGTKKFGNISFFALTLLSLPYSNGVVERGFSVMGTVKTKLRNKLAVRTVNAILQIW